MRILADENIHSSVIEFLKSKGIDIITTDELTKNKLKDIEIAELAQKENRTILTSDLDFGYIYYFEKRNLISVIVIRAKPSTPENIIRLLSRFLELKREFQGLVIISEKKIRTLK